MMYLKTIHIGLLLTALSFNSEAILFNSCSSNSFQTQHSVARMYGVNPLTDNDYFLPSHLAGNCKTKEVALSIQDDATYDWNYEWAMVVKIDNDLLAEPLLAANQSVSGFCVGNSGLKEKTTTEVKLLMLSTRFTFTHS
jgi:hypothetical protein